MILLNACTAIAMAGFIPIVIGQEGAPTLRLRGSSSHSSNKEDVSHLPEFFPTNMNKEDVEFYLEGMTSPITVVNKDDWVHQCARTFQEYSNPSLPHYIARSNFYLIDEPSGLCADALTCAFDECQYSKTDYHSLVCLGNQTDLSSASYDDLASTCNFPPSSLPDRITFPKNAADVISAIKYAKKHNLQVSIKSTGHSYSGSNTKAGSLMLNMRDYVKYASGNDKIIECDGGTSDDDILGDSCNLAKARGKNAYIRVGGGQTWSDVYIAVNASNVVGNLSREYAIGGGAAGSVGSAGGWLSGGGLSIGYEREHGLGVDQVLELEVALPSGHHVRVFPTEWDANQDYITPQTTKVTALCNTNVVANENNWKWQSCTDLSVSPEDLWVALRGGGAGYGVTLSVTYQLFEQTPIQVIYMGLGALTAGNQTGALDDEAKDAFESIVATLSASGTLLEETKRIFTQFVIDFLFAPEKIGVSKEMSLSCGGPATFFMFEQATFIGCWGTEEVYPEITSAWKRTVKDTELAKTDPELANLLSNYITFDGASFGQGPYSSYGELSLDLHKKSYPNYDKLFPPDVIPDDPFPTLTPDRTVGTYCSVNLPLALLQSDDGAERDMLFKILNVVGGEHTTGGNVPFLSDGMDAVSPTERRSGQSSTALQGAIDKYGESILHEYLTAVYKYVGDDVKGFPGFSEYNHMCAQASTVSKANWTQSCDPESNEECFSVQELVWGEELYGKLQDIKFAVDPDNLFDCYQCVKPR